MSDTLNETAAQVAALIPKYSWELMDESQRDALMEQVVLPRYMKTTADGVETGPKFWSELVGATAEAVRSRVKRLRQSQKSGDGERSRALDSSERHATSVLRNPEKRRRIIESLTPEERVQIAAAATPEPLEREPEHVEITGPPERKGTDPSQYEIDEPLERAASALQLAADRIEKFGVRSMRPSDLHDTVTGIVENVAKISGAVNTTIAEGVQQ